MQTQQASTFNPNPNLHPSYIMQQIHICILLINRAVRNNNTARVAELEQELAELSILVDFKFSFSLLGRKL